VSPLTWSKWTNIFGAACKELVYFFVHCYFFIIANDSFNFLSWITFIDVFANWILLICLFINIDCVWIWIALDTNSLGPSISNIFEIPWNNELPVWWRSWEKCTVIVLIASLLFENTLFDWAWSCIRIMEEIIWIQINFMSVVISENVIFFVLIETDIFYCSRTRWGAACCFVRISCNNRHKECWQDIELHFIDVNLLIINFYW